MKNCSLTGTAATTWAEVKESLGLEEVDQEMHTRFQRGRRAASSRLDRFYISRSMAEKAVRITRAYLLPAGEGGGKNNMGLADRIKKREAMQLISRLSDHLAVGMDFLAKS
jgi:hypothetical protein